jgi:hypothetical protein
MKEKEGRIKEERMKGKKGNKEGMKEKEGRIKKERRREKERKQRWNDDKRRQE